MEKESVLSCSVASVLEDVLQEQGTGLSDRDLECRKAAQAALRRYEVTNWLRRTVGIFGAKGLPSEPTEDEFRNALRNGIILCHALNKVLPGAIPKVVEAPSDVDLPPDGAALSVYQYFENVRNFLVAVEQKGIPTFEASDLNQGGKCDRVVNCVLALISYSEWKQAGGNGSWKFGGALKPNNSGKVLMWKNLEPFTNSLARNPLMNDKVPKDFVGTISNGEHLVQEHTRMGNSCPLNVLIQTILSNKKPEEVPGLVELMLNKVIEEFERRLADPNVMRVEAVRPGHNPSTSNNCSFFPKNKEKTTQIKQVECLRLETIEDKELIDRLSDKKRLFEQQKRDIQELRHCLHATKSDMQCMQMKYFEEFSNLGQQLNGLAHAASSYHKVLEENRKLYNQVQDLKGNIRVYCRVRPFLPGQHHKSTVDHIEEGNITIILPSKTGKEARRSFNFNKVFGPSSTQAEIFADTQPLVRSVLDGYNVCIFAYGQTGSGKTYTMSGPSSLKEENQGVNYRALSDLFHLSEQRKDTISYDVAVQMIEIYNEQVRDLLTTDAGFSRRLEIRNNSQKGLNVPDASLVSVYSTSDVLELMNFGQRNRAVGATALNDRSSRSHSCLTVHVQGKDNSSGVILKGCMHLVDLAGSERVDKSEVTGDRLKEAQHINKSLSALGDVISALAQKNSHVPYRNSKLTQLLQDSLGRQAKTLMFVHISPEREAVGETIGTLKFAERVATVELGAAQTNKESGEVKKLKDQIAVLKAALQDRGELEQIPAFPSPNSISLKAPICSTQSGGNLSSSSSKKQRQPMGDVGNREESFMRQRSPILDLQELMSASNSPLWPDNSSKDGSQKEDEKETNPREWVDKMMVNKQEVRLENPLRYWQGCDLLVSDILHQRSNLDMSIFPEEEYASKSQNYDTIMTSDSVEIKVASSGLLESSDMLLQSNSPKLANPPAGSISKIKKSQKKLSRSPDLRSSSPLQNLSHSKKMSQRGGHSQKTTKVDEADPQRCLSNAKVGGGK